MPPHLKIIYLKSLSPLHYPYTEAYLNYFVTIKKSEGNDDVLIFMILIIVSTFLLKNIFNYLSLFFITYLRNGVIKDVNKG